MDRELAAAVAARYHAVNGHHPTTAEDDAYASEWFVPVEELAAVTSHGVDEIRRLQLANPPAAAKLHLPRRDADGRSRPARARRRGRRLRRAHGLVCPTVGLAR